MDDRSYFREIKTHCTLKNCSLRLNVLTNKEKHFFRNNYFGSHPFTMNCYFTKICVHLPVTAAVCYFSVYILIGWDPANIYLSKVNSRNTRKRYEICLNFTINTIETFLVSLWLSVSNVDFE